jgi:hypothetical protein
VRISIKQIVAALVGAAIAVGLSLAGLKWYKRAQVQTPLTQSVAHIPGVRRVRLDASGGSLTIWLTPTANIASVYPRVAATLKHVAGGSVSIQVADTPTPAETALMARLQFVLATGEATGQYVTMQQQVAAAARAAHEPVSLQLDASYLYITIGTVRPGGPDHRLIHVFPLPKGGVAGA